MRLLAFVLFLLASSSSALAQAGRCATLPAPPAPAAAAGYTQRIFCDDFPDLSSIDINDTGAPGYKWYPRMGWPGYVSGRCSPGVPTDIWCQTTPTALASYFALHPGGGLDFTPLGTGSLVGGQSGGAIMSCRTNGVANQYIGTALTSQSYVRINFINRVPAIVGPPSLSNPDVWSEPVEWISGPPSPDFLFVEDDYAEDGSFGANPGNGNLYEDHSIDGSPAGSTKSYGYWGGVSIVNGTVGRLLVPRAAPLTAYGGGGTGEVSGWVSDTTMSPPPGTPVTWTNPTDRFVEMENMHYCMIIWTGIQTLSIGSVEVWAAPSRSPTPPAGAGLWKMLHRR